MSDVVQTDLMPADMSAEIDIPPVPLLVPLMSGPRKREYVVSSLLYLLALVYFWTWWLQPEHNADTVRYIIITLVVAWVTFLPLYPLGIFLNSRAPAPNLRAPRYFRVAMVVTKAPSEPFSIVAETLEAMLRQTYPCDVWLADEDPSEETIAWCVAHGVRISTRRGRDDYHLTIWPRRTRCKEGNLAFFYDQYGYEAYDIVSQLDADHVPSDTYLEEMVKPFADPAVGYVSAPSICDKNADNSWSARGRLYAEGTLHGALQAGYNNGWAPLCIGSHYAVRTKALKQIGGLGPELAEDHSTTLIMNAHGWQGVHALNAIAHGDGPNTFADLMTQEFQWSRSLMMILLQFTPTYYPTLPRRLKFQFLFSELWYPLFSLFMAVMYVMPIAALIFDVNFVNIAYPSFLLHFLPISIILVAIAYRLKSSGWFRPYDAKVLSWEGLLFLFARWPWSLIGTIAGIRDWLSGTVVDFRVTPKGTDSAGPLPIRVLAPYAFLSLASALPALLLTNIDIARGFYIFAFVNAAIYALLLIVILARHIKENGIELNWKPMRLMTAQATLALSVSTVSVAAVAVNGDTGLQALAWGTQSIGLTKISYTVSGAGQGIRGATKLTWNPDFWSEVWRRD